MDNVSPSKRSHIMAQVKSKGNKSTELTFIKFLKKELITGWKRNYSLYGNPDFAFPRKRIALFIDGCLWHGCKLHCRIPSTNRKYWLKKIRNNKKRDKKINRILRVNGWLVIRFWEHELKDNIILHKLRKIRNRTLKDSLIINL